MKTEASAQNTCVIWIDHPNRIVSFQKAEGFWCPLTGVTLQVSEPPADIASAVSAGDFFLSHAPLAVD